MTVFKTLLLREWMQHHRGWLILCGIPVAVVILGLTFGSVELSGEETGTHVALVMSFGYAIAVTMLAWVAVVFQVSGLARRDVQDRSIEFWRSLPVSDAQSVAATTLSHLVLFPLGVMALAVASGLVLAPLAVMRVFGAGALLELPWGILLGSAAMVVPRLLLGVLLASLWAAPLLLMSMAASAWLKRWGMPVLAVVLGAGSAILKQAYGMPWLSDSLEEIFKRFGVAMIPGSRGDIDFEAAPFPGGFFENLPGWLMHDALNALRDLASPLFGVACLVSAVSFALLVWKRQHH